VYEIYFDLIPDVTLNTELRSAKAAKTEVSEEERKRQEEELERKIEEERKVREGDYFIYTDMYIVARGSAAL
jgi:hypothetical protein